MPPKIKNWQKATIVASITLVSVLFLFWLTCLNHVSINHVGVAYNSLTGEIKLQEKPGWYLTSPMVMVVKLSTLPLRVEIPSGAKIINMKIVRFKPEGAEEFVKLQGFSYFLNSSLSNILLGYAYSGKPYPFLEIIQEGGPADVSSPPQGK